jgi:hypothetical protein
MALTGNFSLFDVNNEFGINTRPFGGELSDFHQAIIKESLIDGISWINHRDQLLLRNDNGQLRDFTDTGKPTISNITSGSNWNYSQHKYQPFVSCSVNSNNLAMMWDNTNQLSGPYRIHLLDAKVGLEYHIDDGETPFSSQTTGSVAPTTLTGNTTYSSNTPVFDNGLTICVRIYSFNEYNKTPSDYDRSNVINIVIPSNGPTLDTPSITGLIWQLDTVEVSWTDSNVITDMDYVIKYKVDNGSTEYTDATIDAGTKLNWGTNNTKSATWEITNIPNNTIEVSIQARRAGYQNSSYSSYASA